MSDEFLERQFLGIVEVCKYEIAAGRGGRRSVPCFGYKVHLVQGRGVHVPVGIESGSHDEVGQIIAT